MDFKSMIQFRLKSCFGNAMPAGACSGFLSSGVASLSSGVEATASMRDRPLLKALAQSYGWTALITPSRYFRKRVP